MNDDWMDMNFQQNFNDRTDRVHITDNSRLRIGKNCIMNRMSCINNKIKFDWLNQSFESYKNQMQNDFSCQFEK